MRFLKKYWMREHGGRALALLVAVCAGSLQAAPATTPQKASTPMTNSAPRVVVIPKSVFHDDVTSGDRDPFYPRSARRMQSAPAAGASKEAQSAAPKANTLLSLKGIVSGAENRKLALINNRHFAVGETNEVNVEGGKLVVQCLEIKEVSVVVRVVGKPERYDLRMRLE
jgi:hypothetical protein